MKLLLGANLSPEVARLLKEEGHDVIHVGGIGLLSAPDPEILQAAANEERVLLAANLPRIAEDLEKGAIASLARERLRVRALPITTEEGDR